MSARHEAAQVQALILRHLGRMRGRDPATLDPQRPFNELGIDSLDAITLTGDLEHDLGMSIDPAEILEHPTPLAFATHLATRTDPA